MKTCKECGVKLNKSQVKFCSRSCSASFNNRGVRRHKGKLSNCLFCGQNLNRKISKFCSNQCQADYQWERKKSEILKGICGNAPTLKKFILERDGHICSICGTKEWMDKPIPLVLDHIDGDSTNNFPDNLRLVCGNCDMQLPTYKNKNKGNGRYTRRIRYAEGKSY